MVWYGVKNVDLRCRKKKLNRICCMIIDFYQFEIEDKKSVLVNEIMGFVKW